MVNPMWSPNPWDKVRPQYRELRALLFSTSMARDSVTGVTRNQTSKPLQTPQIDLRSFKLVSFLNVLWSRTGHSYFQGHISAHTAFFLFFFFALCFSRWTPGRGSLVTLMIFFSKGEHTIFVSLTWWTLLFSLIPCRFTVHPDKSVFIPSQRLVLLGFIFDSATMTIILTPENALKVKEACGTILGQGGSRGRVQGVRTPPPLRWSFFLRIYVFAFLSFYLTVSDVIP